MLLSANAAIPTWSTSTIPTSAGATANKVLLSDGTNYVLSTPTFPNASATSGKIIKSDGTNWIASTETYATPGSSGNLMQSDGTNWTSSSQINASVLPAGTLFNLQQGQLTTTTSVTSSSPTFADISGLSIAITPTSSSNKVLVRAIVTIGSAVTSVAYAQLVRGSTAIGIATSVGSRTAAGSGNLVVSANQMTEIILEWLDSPATTSSTTYKVQLCSSDGGAIQVNRSSTDTNLAAFGRGVSTITVYEVHA
jgi:hypothetical protein